MPAVKTSLLAICFLLTTIVSGASCRSARPDMLMVNPIYKAGKTPLTVTWAPPGTAVDVSIVEGRRSPAGAIGRNIEEGKPVKIFENPAGGSLVLVRGAMASELRAAGFSVSDGAPAPYRVQITLQRFWVEEENTYLGEVRLRVSVFGSSGEVLGDAVVSGTSSRWGRSLSEENYQETFDSALRDAIEKLFKDPRFQDAFRSA